MVKRVKVKILNALAFRIFWHPQRGISPEANIPALAAGDLGIAMGAIGSDIAINSASIALMTNDLRRIAMLIFLSKKSQVIINQNLIFGMLFVFGGMILSIVGLMTPIWAAVIHAGSTLVIVFNSARLVRTGEELTLNEKTDSEKQLS